MDLESLFVLRRCCISAAPSDCNNVFRQSSGATSTVFTELREQERSNSANVGFRTACPLTSRLRSAVVRARLVTIAWPFLLMQTPFAEMKETAQTARLSHCPRPRGGVQGNGAREQSH
jgi:hypothetical protein